MSTYQPPAPMSDSELRKTAASQIDLEINQAVDPIQSSISQTQAREDKALGQIGGMFDALQPVVQQAATAVQTSYDQAMGQEHSLFATAQSQLQALRGNRAADAQAMAQQTGGPVAIGDWTQPFDNAATDLTQLGAGQQLHTLAYAQAGEQQAQQFSGQVFPLVRTEQMAASRNTFEEQIRGYQDQITALKAQKGAQVNKRYNELRTQELEYGLKQAQFNLDKIDSQRNYNLEVKKAKTDKANAQKDYNLRKQDLALTKKKNEDDLKIALKLAGNNKRQTDLAYKQYDLANKEYLLEVGKAVGKIDGVPTLEKLQSDAQIKQAAATLGLQKKELKARIHEFAVNSHVERAKLKSDQSTEWTALLENAVNPQPGKTYTVSEEQEISGTAALFDQSGDVYTKMIDGSLHYYKRVEHSETVPAMQAITDPTALVDYLVKAMNDPSFSKQRAIALVKARFPAFTSWKYGDKWPPAAAAKPKGKKGTARDLLPLPDWTGTPTPGSSG